MKKFFLTLAALTLAAGAATADEATFNIADYFSATTVNIDADGPYTIKLSDDISLTLRSEGNLKSLYSKKGGGYIATRAPGSMTFTGAAGVTIEKMVFTTYYNYNYPSDLVPSTGSVNPSSTEPGIDITWIGNASEVALDITAPGSGEAGFAWQTLVVTYSKTAAPELKDPEIRWSEDTFSISLDAENPVFPTLSFVTDAQPVYSSSNHAVATVDQTGKITLVAEGQTVIAAAVLATAEYAEGEASYTLTVTPSTGVDTIGTDTAPARYYNLQGVEVEKPENGVFIRVSAGKTTKVAIR